MSEIAKWWLISEVLCLTYKHSFETKRAQNSEFIRCVFQCFTHNSTNIDKETYLSMSLSD